MIYPDISRFSEGSTKGLVGFMWLEIKAKFGVLITIVVEPLLTASNAETKLKILPLNIPDINPAKTLDISKMKPETSTFVALCFWYDYKTRDKLYAILGVDSKDGIHVVLY